MTYGPARALPGDQIRITKLRSHEYVVDKLE